MYNHLRNLGGDPSTHRNFNLIWKDLALNKVKTFVWLMFHNWLPTYAYLNHIGLPIPFQYHLCQNQEETINYIFFQCQNIAHLWAKLFDQAQFNPLRTGPTWMLLPGKQLSKSLEESPLISGLPGRISSHTVVGLFGSIGMKIASIIKTFLSQLTWPFSSLLNSVRSYRSSLTHYQPYYHCC